MCHSSLMKGRKALQEQVRLLLGSQARIQTDLHRITENGQIFGILSKIFYFS